MTDQGRGPVRRHGSGSTTGPARPARRYSISFDGAAGHASERLNFAVLHRSFDHFAEERGWRRLQLLSSAGNTYNRDYLGETAGGTQMPMLNVFHRAGEVIHHFWGAELTYAPMDPGQDHRSVGTLEPLWNLFDLTREGRPTDWDEQLSYS